MAKYFYQARTAKGQIITGQLEADDESDARVLLRSRSLVPLKVIQVGGTTFKKASVGIGTPRVKSRDLQIFTRQFSTLISAGIPILESLKILSEGKKSPILKAALIKVKEGIESGKKLGESMSYFPNVFDRLYVNMMKAGEEAGILDGILQRLAFYLEKSEKIKKQIKSAMIYPIMIITIAIIVVTGILVFIIPKFQDLYNNSGKALPEITLIVISMSKFCIEKWYILILVIIGCPILLMQWMATPEGKEIVERFLIGSPLFGEVVQKASVARMSRTLSTLLSAGVPLVDALEIAAKTSGNVVIEETLIRCKESVIQGKTLAGPLMKEKLIPDMVSQMVAIGETSGTLDSMLGKVADFYEDDVENAVKGMTSLLEPILMVVLGGVIAFLVIAMYLPIFDLASIQGG
jgi:type IV pilus assembly protein PilC